MKKYSVLNNVKYIYKEAYKIKKPLPIWLIMNFITSLVNPILGTIISSLVVYLLTNGYSINNYVLYIGIIVMGMIVFSCLKTYSFQRFTWENTFIRCGAFWTRLSDKAISCDYELIEPKSGQKKLSKAFEALDSNWIGIEGMMKETPVVMIDIVGMLIYLSLVAIYCPFVLIPMFFMVVTDLIFTYRADRIIEKDREASNDAYYERSYLSRDIANPNNGKDIRIYKLQKWFARRFDILTKNRLKSENRYHLNSLGSELSHTAFEAIRDVIAYITLIAMVLNKSIDVSSFVFMIGITAGFSTWVNGFSSALYRLKSDSAQVKCYRIFIDEIEERDSNTNKLPIETVKTPLKIEFRNVCFTYPDTKIEIIHDLSFVIDEKEKVALVGNNGAGKTTIIKLMCGLYTPTSGDIYVNNINIREYKRNEYAKLISAVFQDSQELAFTIFENVTCTPYDKGDKNIFYDSIIKAGLKEKIESLPDKEDTYLTQNFKTDGIRLSGGEIQRLMLARALYKQAPLLLLDEPTASLDPINEEKIYILYQNLCKENTSVFISHRLASTRFCNRILYLENGKVLESGSHDELLKLNGKYKTMFDIQAQYYKEG